MPGTGRRARARVGLRRLRHGLHGRHDRAGARQAEGLPAAGRPGRALLQQQLAAHRQQHLHPVAAAARHAAHRARARPAQRGAGRGRVRHRHDAPDRRARLRRPRVLDEHKAIINAGITASTPDPPDGFIGRDATACPNGLFADFSANWGPTPPAPARRHLHRARPERRRGQQQGHHVRTCGRAAASNDLALVEADRRRRASSPSASTRRYRRGAGARRDRPGRDRRVHRRPRRASGARTTATRARPARASSTSTR